MRNADRSGLSGETIVQPPADMQAGDRVAVAIVTEHCESMLQRTGSDPHVMSRNGTAAVSECPIHYGILRCCSSVNHQLVYPLRRQKQFKFLAILDFACSNGKAAEQFPKHNTIDPNPRGVRSPPPHPAYPV